MSDNQSNWKRVWSIRLDVEYHRKILMLNERGDDVAAELRPAIYTKIDSMLGEAA